MEIATLILEYVKAIIWPVLVLVTGIVFRHELRTMLLRVRRAELPGGFAVDIPLEIAEGKRLSDQIRTTPTQTEKLRGPAIPLTEANARMMQLGLRPSPSGLDMDYYRTHASQDPTLALAGLRIEIDILAKNVARGFKVPFQERDSGTRLLRKLFDSNAITEEQMQLGVKVLQLCNTAVHGTTISREQAVSVIDIAEVLADQFLAWLSWGFEE